LDIKKRFKNKGDPSISMDHLYFFDIWGFL
jgi:hypothetical protein